RPAGPPALPRRRRRSAARPAAPATGAAGPPPAAAAAPRYGSTRAARTPWPDLPPARAAATNSALPAPARPSPTSVADSCPHPPLLQFHPHSLCRLRRSAGRQRATLARRQVRTFRAPLPPQGGEGSESVGPRIGNTLGPP